MPNLNLILGVTASGKGKAAFELARNTGSEIISVDSMKVYRRMDIGTAKPSPEHRRQVRYHLIDVAEPGESFSVDRFLNMADEAVRKISAAGKPIVAVGGTAMYIKALLYGIFEGPAASPQIRQKLKDQIAERSLAPLHRKLVKIDPEAAERIHPNDEKRIIRALEVYEITGQPISSLQQQFNAGSMRNDWRIIGLRRPKETESHRINLRVKRIIEEGLVQEVKNLLAEPVGVSMQARCAIGYAEIIEHLEGKITLAEAIEKIKINSRRLAKAQRTWFKTFRQVHWLDIEETESAENICRRVTNVLEDR